MLRSEKSVLSGNKFKVFHRDCLEKYSSPDGREPMAFYLSSPRSLSMAISSLKEIKYIRITNANFSLNNCAAYFIHMNYNENYYFRRFFEFH